MLHLPQYSGSGALDNEQRRAVAVETHSIGEVEFAQNHMCDFRGGVIVQQLAIRSPLVRLQNHVCTGKLFAGICEKDAPVGQNCQIVAEINERGSLLIHSSPWHKCLDLLQACVNLHQSKAAICSIEHTRGGGMAV